MARNIGSGVVTGAVPARDGSRQELQVGDRSEAARTERMAAASPAEPLLPDRQQPVAMVEDRPPSDPGPLRAELAAGAEAVGEPLFSPVVVAQAPPSSSQEFMPALVATAATGDGPATDGDGNRFVRLLRITEGVDALSYAYPHPTVAGVTASDPVGEPVAAPVPVFVTSLPPPVPPPVAPAPADLRSVALEVDEAAVAGGNGVGQSTPGASASGQVWSGGASGSLSTVRIGVAGEFAPIALPAHGSVSIAFDRDGQPLATGSTQPAAARLDVDAAGGYTFTVLGGLDHEAVQGRNSMLLPHVVHLLGTDGQGVSTVVDLSLVLRDDVPVLPAGGPGEVVRLDERDLLAQPGTPLVSHGDVRDQASWGADGFGHVTGMSWNGGTVAIPAGTAGVTLYFDPHGQVQAGADGAAAHLSVQDDGSYTFTLAHNLLLAGGQHNVVSLLGDGFSLSAQDGDGDLVSGIPLRIELVDAGPGAARLRLPTGSDETGDSNDRVWDYPPHALVLDESPPDDPGTAVLDGNGWSSRSEDFSVYFHSDRGRGHDAASSDAVDYGADGKGDFRFSLGLTATDAAGQVSAVDGIGSGIHALDPSGSGRGPEILLYRVDDSMIEGRVGSQSYFTLHVDAATGVVEFARGAVGIWNPVAGDGDDRAILLGDDAALTTGGGHALVLTQTISDADGDTSSVSARLAGYGVTAAPLALAPDLFSIADDAPVAPGLRLMLGGAGSVERHVGAEVGADGGMIQSVTVDGAGYDNHGMTEGGAGSWNAATKTWEIQTSGGATLTVDMDGDPGNPQDHGLFRYSTPLDASLVETFDYTLVDGDGDTSSATLTVSVGGDFVSGNAQADVLVADGGDRTLYGGDGDDTLLGGAGADSLYGGDGSDLLSGGPGDDLIDGGDNPPLSVFNNYVGGDTASYADAAPVSGTQGVTVSLAVAGPQDTRAAGIDTLVGIEHLIGSAHDDSLTGDDGRNRLAGGAGNDSLFGGAGSDTLVGGAGADVLHGEGDGDSLLGGAGDDWLDGGEGDDTLRGDAGSDTLYGGSGNDSLFGGDGDDLLDGGAGDDTLRGDAGNDTLRGGDGDDVVTGGAGDDILDGGAHGAAGDTASYADAAPGPGRIGVTVSLALSGPQDTGSAGRDTLLGIENLLGSNYDDVLGGDDGANRLRGGAGNDTLSGGRGDDWLQGQAGADVLEGDDGNDILDGGRGDDTLFGGAGSDTLTGGAGADVFAWRLADRDASTDHVTDFKPGEGDVLDLRELLDGEHGAADFNLGQYLRFDVSGQALALVIDHDGGSTFVAQQAIVFDNLADRQALAAVLGSATDDTAILHQMISAGSLKVDP